MKVTHIKGLNLNRYGYIADVKCDKKACCVLSKMYALWWNDYRRLLGAVQTVMLRIICANET